jgi:hypothetical protein
MNLEFICKMLGIKPEMLKTTVNEVNNLLTEMYIKIDKVEKLLEKIEENTRNER